MGLLHLSPWDVGMISPQTLNASRITIPTLCKVAQNVQCMISHQISMYLNRMQTKSMPTIPPMDLGEPTYLKIIMRLQSQWQMVHWYKDDPMRFIMKF